MNNTWRVKAILTLLSGIPLKEANAVLFDVKQRLEVKQPVKDVENTVCPNAYRKPRLTKIESDPEVKEFILSTPYMPQAEILLGCRERFGNARTPSRTGLSRFLTKLRKTK